MYYFAWTSADDKIYKIFMFEYDSFQLIPINSQWFP